MKTNTNISTKLTATIFAIFFSGMIVFAQESFNKNLLAQLTSTELTSMEFTGVEAAVFEAELPVEDWMLETNAWSASIETPFNDMNEELELEVENWMVEPVKFENSIAEPKDEALIIEDWMINSTSWKK